jgi:hypothetical protein
VDRTVAEQLLPRLLGASSAERVGRADGRVGRRARRPARARRRAPGGAMPARAGDDPALGRRARRGPGSPGRAARCRRPRSPSSPVPPQDDVDLLWPTSSWAWNG